MNQSSESFEIKTGVFEGPLDLLIELIEKRKLLINDISIATVTDDYINFVSELEKQSLTNISEFLSLASTLLLIKSKSLLPVLNLSKEEEESIEDLQERLRIYQIFRDAGNLISQNFNKNNMYARRFVQTTNPLFVTDSYTEKNSLVDAIKAVLTNLPKHIKKPRVKITKTISLQEMMSKLKQRVESQIKIKLQDLAGDEGQKNTLIIGFLAILEMVKQNKVTVTQQDKFEDIEVEKKGFTTPQYL